jgi:tetratricopeptide (TPR) repeat protein
VAHLAAAMGKPVWLLLPADADYRWMDKREDSPWYPSMRLFRQVLSDTFNANIGSHHWYVMASLLTETLRQHRPKLSMPDAQTLRKRKLQAQERMAQQDNGTAQRILEHLVDAGTQDSEVLNQLGNLYQLSDRQAEAVELYQTVLRLNPNLVATQSNLGGALVRMGRHADALKMLQKALRANAQIPQLQYNMGSALYELQRYEEALRHFEMALRLKPTYFLAQVYRSNVLMALDRNDDAMKAIEAAHHINPNYPEIHYNRAIVLQRLGEFDRAHTSYESAISLKPDFHKALWNYSLLLLMQGDYERGWPLYEERWLKDGFERRRTYPQSLWVGQEDLRGKCLLVYPEQGLGDYIQSLRYIQLLVERGVHVYLEAPMAMMEMVQCLSGPQVSVFELEKAPSNFDMHCPCMTLPLAFRTRVDTIPNPGPYLHVPREFQKHWLNLLPKQHNSSKLRIGLAWSGAAGHQNDRQRSLQLHQLQGLLEAPNLEFHSLQREYREHDKALLRKLVNKGLVHDHAAELRQFADTAALMEQLDIVVSVDTSVAHMAGAIGRPVLLLVAFEPDFRWLLNRADSPWYDHFEILRQPQRGDWATVVQRVAVRLDSLRT